MLLGIAKLLPQVVPVKGETLQVVSLAMTGLVRRSSLVFHIVENAAQAAACVGEAPRQYYYFDGRTEIGGGFPSRSTGSWMAINR